MGDINPRCGRENCFHLNDHVHKDEASPMAVPDCGKPGCTYRGAHTHQSGPTPVETAALTDVADPADAHLPAGAAVVTDNGSLNEDDVEMMREAVPVLGVVDEAVPSTENSPLEEPEPVNHNDPPLKALVDRPPDIRFVPDRKTEELDLVEGTHRGTTGHITDPQGVNHPKHYNVHPSGVECIELIRHLDFNVGNAIKYVWRRNDKGTTKQDLEKAKFYLTDERHRRVTWQILPRIQGEEEENRWEKVISAEHDTAARWFYEAAMKEDVGGMLMILEKMIDETP